MANNVKAFITAQPDIALGCTIYRSLSVVNAGQLVKAGSGVLYGYFIANVAATVRYIKFYDKATAPTVGTDVPVLTLAMPAASSANVYLGPGVPFSLGVGIGATVSVADAAADAPAANEVIVNLLFK